MEKRFIGCVFDRLERDPNSVRNLTRYTRVYASYVEAHEAAETLLAHKYGRKNDRFEIRVKNNGEWV